MARSLMLLFAIFLLFWAIDAVWADCILYVTGADGLAVENAPITLYNHSNSGLLYSNSTDANGLLTYSGSCDHVNFTVSYAVSSYSAVLGNLSISTPVPLGGYLTGRVQISNTLGSYLEGQDCSVVALDNASNVVYDFQTLCKDEPHIVCSGSVCNYASVSGCTFSDSMGNYYFSSKIDESKNFVYGRNYTLKVTCNGKNVSAAFSVGLERQTDMEKMEASIRANTGIIFLGFIGLLLLAALVGLLLYVGNSGKKGGRKGKGF